MKGLEKLVKSYIMCSTGAVLDPLQFGYHTRGVVDAKLFLLETIHSYLEKIGTFARLLLPRN